ncbi:MAG: Trm112 family protein [Candidatus Aenigmatarchaeota archaeon]|nr:MAG: Trm112 family protein [Candidatus Aenigmarchaeota archaeon]
MDKELLKIMACPKCKGDIEEKGMFLICKKCKLAYPILNGRVPNMIIDEAWSLEKAKKSKFKHKLKL